VRANHCCPLHIKGRYVGMETARQNYFHFHTRSPSASLPPFLPFQSSLRSGLPISPGLRLPHSMLADQADLPILADDEDVTDALFSGPRALTVYQWLIRAKATPCLQISAHFPVSCGSAIFHEARSRDVWPIGKLVYSSLRSLTYFNQGSNNASHPTLQS